MQYTANSNNDEKNNYVVGVILAVSSSLFIGSSFVFKKISLLNLGKTNSIRAAAGGFGYLKDWIWWMGFLFMGIGELFNLFAYGFAPASLVTPLGSLSVLISTLLASKFLQESLTLQGKVGCILCLIGSLIIILNAPKEVEANSVLSFENLQKPMVVFYTIFVILSSLVLIFCVVPKFGQKFVLIYIFLCSQVGSFSVMACKVLALSIRNQFEENVLESQHNVIILSFLILCLCICVQLNYLNRALDIFGTSVVTPIYYTVFTTLVLFFSGILFDEWKRMNDENIFGVSFGLVVSFFAIFLLHLKKEKVKERVERNLLLECKN